VELEAGQANTTKWLRLAILYGSLASTSRRRFTRLRGCVERDGRSWQGM